LRICYHRTLNVSIKKQKENKYNINNKKYKCLKLDENIIKIKKRKIPFAVHVGIYYNRKKHRKII